MPTRRYVFAASKIAALKALATSSGVVQNPTRVELVTALICKCAIAARLEPTRPAVPQSQLVWSDWWIYAQRWSHHCRIIQLEIYFGSLHQRCRRRGEMELSDLVGNLRKGITHFNIIQELNCRGDQWSSLIRESMKEGTNLFNTNNGMNVCKCTSFCRLPLCQVDFGWGKPIWATVCALTLFKNTILMMDTNRGDGSMGDFGRTRHGLLWTRQGPPCFCLFESGRIRTVLSRSLQPPWNRDPGSTNQNVKNRGFGEREKRKRELLLIILKVEHCYMIRHWNHKCSSYLRSPLFFFSSL